MTQWAPEKKDTLRAVASEILHNYARGRVFVAVDGLDGSGTDGFADDLAAAFIEQGHAAFRASLGDFSKPRAQRDSSKGVSGVVDESKLRRMLVEPFRLGGSTGWSPKAFDAVADREVETSWVTGPADAVLVVDGAQLNSPELATLWNYSIYVEGASPVGKGDDERFRSTAVIDNRDPAHPRRLFDDAC